AVVGLTEDVAVASETRSDGPWTADFGCYGISLKTGDLLWASHAAGLWGRVLRLLDSVPFFTNDLRDTPARVRGNEVICNSGRVLDVHTGADLRRVPREEVRKGSEKPSDALQLFAGLRPKERTRIKIGENRWLSHKKQARDADAEGFRLYLLDD